MDSLLGLWKSCCSDGFCKHQLIVACVPLFTSSYSLLFSVMLIFILELLAGLCFHSLPTFSGRPLSCLVMPVHIGILLSKPFWTIFYMLPCVPQDCSHEELPLSFCKSVLHFLSHGTTSQAQSKVNIVCPGQGLHCSCAEAAGKGAVKYSPISSHSQFFDLCMEGEMLSNFLCVCEDFMCRKSCSGWSEISGTSSFAESKIVTSLNQMKNFLKYLNG